MTRSVLIFLLFVGLSACDLGGAQSDRVLAEGLAKAKAGKVSDAMIKFDEAIRLDADNADAYYNRAVIRLQKMNSPGAAIDDLKRAVEIRPDWPEAQLQLGVALLDTGREGEAYETLKTAMEQGNASAGAAYRVGQIDEEKGDIRDAIDAYTTAIYSDPAKPEPFSSLGRLYMDYGHVAEAKQVFQNGIENNPSDPELRADLGTAAFSLNEYSDAIPALKEAIERGDRRLSTTLVLAKSYMGRHEDLGGAEDRRQAIRYFKQSAGRCSPKKHGKVLCRTLQDKVKKFEEDAEAAKEAEASDSEDADSDEEE